MKQTRWQARRELFVTLLFPSGIVAIAFLLITLWSWRSAAFSLKQERNDALDSRVDVLKEQLTKQLSDYEVILKGGAGMAGALDGQLSATQWQRFVGALGFTNRPQGIVGLGYAPIVPLDNLPQINQKLDEYSPGTAVRPEGRRDSYAPIQYLEPLNDDNRQALGFDLYSDPLRRRPMERARDSGQAALSDKLHLLQDKSRPNVPAFLLFVPVYAPLPEHATVQQRRDALRGYVYAPLRAGEFVSNAYKVSEETPLNFRIYSKRVEMNELLYESPSFQQISHDPHYLSREDRIYPGGSEWILQLRLSDSVVSPAVRYRPAAILTAGLLISAASALLLYAILRSRLRHLRHEQDREIQLAKDDLLSLASHQLRTPATGVKQYMGMVMEGYAGALNEQQRDYLEKAYQSNERQLHIINDLLYVARADAGRIILSKQSIDVVRLMREIVDELHSVIESRRHRVTTRFPKKPVMISADEHSLRMALENIVDNAATYMPDGGLMQLSVQQYATEVVITVKDKGVGMEADELPLIFKQFTRLPNERSSQTSGSGVGLYLARYLIQLHDGTIRVTSRPGKGSTFTVTLPRR